MRIISVGNDMIEFFVNSKDRVKASCEHWAPKNCVDWSQCAAVDR